MTKYEELKSALFMEERRLMEEFLENTADGDLARLNGKLGVLIKDKFSTADVVRFCPVILGGIDTGNIYDLEHDTEITTATLPKIKLEKCSIEEFLNFVQEKVKESEDIPF